MVDVDNQNEERIELTGDLDFVEINEPAAGSEEPAAYAVRCPADYVLTVKAGTPVAPELYDANGNKLDTSTEVRLVKATRQRNEIGDTQAFESQLSAFDYEKMRTDSDYFRRTQETITLDERQYLLVKVHVPSGANAIDQQASNITIGDSTSRDGQPVFMKRKDELPEQHQRAIEAHSQGK